MIIAWRLTKTKHLEDAFSGEDARLFGGRWNNPGTPIVYAAGSQALAALELLVHLDSSEVLAQYVFLPVEFEESVTKVVAPESLAAGWRDDPAPPETREIGDRWFEGLDSVALRVPTTSVPSEHNYLLNPAHRDFPLLRFGEPIAFRFDPRLGSPSTK